MNLQDLVPPILVKSLKKILLLDGLVRVSKPFSSYESALAECKDGFSENGPGPMPIGMKDGPVCYPVTFACKYKFEEIISKNYQIKIQFNEEKKAYLFEDNFIDMYGYFCSLK